ncbi:MAG: hypothetical protein HKN79_04770 [Flavobacteriales bacterium]|nr:hypothetical protein [Flavobacteriales bacterium]
MLDKNELKAHMLDMQDEIITDLKAEIDSYHQGKDLDEEDTMDPEDFSHQAEAGTIELTLKEQLRKAEADKGVLEKLTTEERTDIRPGTLIELEDRYMYISIATLPFEFNGKQVITLTMDAPIYPLIKNKNVGDSIRLGKESHEIKALH